MRQLVGTSPISFPGLHIGVRPAGPAAGWWSLWTRTAAPLGRTNLR